MTEHLRYSMVVQWSDQDEAYLVTFPEWADRVNLPATHGDTYEEAVKNGQQVLAMLVEATRQHGDSLPEARVHAAA